MKKESTWLKLPLELLQHKQTSLSTKIIYTYMLWRYQFFSVKGSKYFEAQDTIATMCNVSRKTVNESIQKLSSLGWVVCTRSTLPSSLYEVKDVYGLYNKREVQGGDVFEEPF